jgi:hypothetical protein
VESVAAVEGKLNSYDIFELEIGLEIGLDDGETAGVGVVSGAGDKVTAETGV